MKKGDRKPNCGICGSLKKMIGNGRLICPECSKRASREFYRNQPKKPLTESQRQAKYKNRKKIRPSGLSNQKVYAMKHRYGISEEQFVEMYTYQNGSCAICEKPITPKQSLVDHCHDTKFIRGLLCRKCNFAIGLLSDNKKYIENAIQYLGNDYKLKIL